MLKRNNSGLVLFEGILIISVFVTILVLCQIALIRQWNAKLQELQLNRRVYDGVSLWKPVSTSNR